MLEVLNFVKGAVATRDIVEALTHFCIRDGVIQASDGRVTITSYAEELRGFDAVVNAEAFLAACSATDGQPKFKMDDHHMFISRGKFRAKLPLLPRDSYPFMEKDTKRVRAKAGGLFGAMQQLSGFMADDATREWACGMLFSGEYAYATNNIVLARMKLPFKVRRLNIPIHAVKQMLKIGYEPDHVCTGAQSITFVYDECSWMRTNLIDAEWPSLEEMLKGLKRIPPCSGALHDDIAKLLPFCADKTAPTVMFKGGSITTQEGDMDAVVADYDLPDAAFRIEPLLSVLSMCTHINFDKYPKACPWRGENGVEGIIIGVRV